MNATEKQEYLVALGANLPFEGAPPEDTLRAALDRLEASGLEIAGRSRMYDTPCFPAGAGPDYVNAAVRLRAALGPEELLARMHEVERAFGRERKRRWGMRTLDLDLLAAGDEVLPDRATWQRWAGLAADAAGREAPNQLILPHPRLAERAFVLLPLADVAPDWRHPVTGLTVREMVQALPADARAEVVARPSED